MISSATTKLGGRRRHERRTRSGLVQVQRVDMHSLAIGVHLSVAAPRP